MSRLLVDTGFLVALFRPADRLRPEARDFLQANRQALHTVAPVLVETCFFLDARQKANLLEWVRRGALAVAEVPVSAYAAVSAVILKYADHDIDFADAALVWLAGESGTRAVLTVDETEFGIYRLKAGKRFDVVKWFRK